MKTKDFDKKSATQFRQLNHQYSSYLSKGIVTTRSKNGSGFFKPDKYGKDKKSKSKKSSISHRLSKKNS